MQILFGGSDPQMSPFFFTWDHTSVPAKWHFITFNGLAGCTSVTDGQSDKRTDGPRYGDICLIGRIAFSDAA